MKNKNSEKSNKDKGLFGQTDRINGKYHFKTGETEEIYSDATFVPVQDDTVPTKYYRPGCENNNRINQGLFAVIVLCVGCALIGGIISAVIMKSYFRHNSQSSALTDPLETLNAYYANSIITKELSGSEIYNLACKQTVVVNTQYKVDSSGASVTGSGFLIDDGYVITNYHVIRYGVENNYSPVVVLYDESYVDCEVVGYDIDNDIAVLKIESGLLNAVQVGDYDSVEVGDKIYIVGDPYGMLEFTMTTGHVSAKDRLVATQSNNNAISMFQIDAATYSGNSGGPVYNEYGEVIGIIAAKMTEGDREGIGFAIPISNAKSIASGIIKIYEDDLSNVSLGAEFDERYDVTYANYYDMPQGAYVVDINPESPAYNAGLKSGDIITQIDQTEIKDRKDVKTVMRGFNNGDDVSLYYYRSGQMNNANVHFD